MVSTPTKFKQNKWRGIQTKDETLYEWNDLLNHNPKPFFSTKEFFPVFWLRKHVRNVAAVLLHVSVLDQVHKFPHVGKFMHLGSGYFTLPSSVNCPVHLHTKPAPSVYTAFLLMPCQLRFEPATMVSQLF